MHPQRFDLLTQILGAVGSRRALTALVAGAAGGLPFATPNLTDSVEARRKKRRKRKRKNKNKKKVKGPCAPGKSRKNSCKKDRQCCTGNCKKGKKAKRGRCRCRKEGQSCTEQRNCCPEQEGRGCFDGTCQTCEVCPSGCPFSGVQAAIDAAVSGDTIHICAGTYTGSVNTLGKDLTLIGVGDDTEGTVLEGDRAVTVPSGTVALTGLRITEESNITPVIGGGVSNRGVLTLTGCTVTGIPVASLGGGIFNDDGAALTLIDCTVSGNSAGSDGGGIYNQGAVTLTGGAVTGNTAEDDGGGIYNLGTLTVNGTTIANNDPNDCVDSGAGTGCPPPA